MTKPAIQAALSLSSESVYSKPLGQMGALCTRFAANEREIEAALRLRHNVFVREMGARAVPGCGQDIETDQYDAHCRHLLVLDGEQVVGTYRMSVGIAGDGAERFYSSGEYRLDNLMRAFAGRKVMEFGRSCVAQPYRNRRTMKLMWQGAWAAAVAEDVSAMFGCASLPGSNIGAHREACAWFAEHALLPPHRDCPPVRGGHDMRLFDCETSKRTFANLPPLIKGYVRIGARLASHAVCDVAFGTTDVLVVLDVSAIAPRYLEHYGKKLERTAA